MGGFLSAYSNTRVVTVGDPNRGYWVSLKEHLSQGDKEVAERSLTSGKVVNGNMEMEVDVARYRQLMVMASIVDWNLDDEDGKIWQVNLQNVRRLPGDEFDRLWTIVDEMNKPASSEERRDFRPDGNGGDSSRNGGRSAEPGHVLAQEDAVEACWTVLGNVEGSPLA